MSHILRSDIDGIATVTLNRPDKLNALDLSLRLELLDAFRELATDESVRVVILTGAGSGFCVGQDLSRSEELVDAAATVRDSYTPLARALRALPQPTIAVVNGAAYGAGLGLALGCDVVFVAESAKISAAFSKVGLVPDTGVTAQLVTALGYLKAFELASTGSLITAQEAVEWGIASRVVPDADAIDRAMSVARTFVKSSPVTLALLKKQLQFAQFASFEDVLELEAVHQGIAAATPEHKALRDAFITK
ncbi:MAG: 2-(1,2-epoxy,2-dihydrophenyl)acetyl-CoA isomerase [Microbacteriaceae bacterium]|nr:2-(1,2-epoxy,2-dihydrophenyl)acetyl-CoA isomerase [Microbacteriaceae bacterium]